MQVAADEARSGRTVAGTSGVSQRDMEQVRPGAGMEIGRSFTSFFSQKGKKQTTEPSGDRGKFVENITLDSIDRMETGLTRVGLDTFLSLVRDSDTRSGHL